MKLVLELPTIAFFANDEEAKAVCTFLTDSTPFEGSTCWGTIKFRYLGIDTAVGSGCYMLFEEPNDADEAIAIEVFLCNQKLNLDTDVDA